MTALAHRNPIAVLMLCIGLMVFACVVTPRMSVDTFPEPTPPVLVIGTLCPGLGPQDVESTIIVPYASGETLNAFTLGGLTLAMGRLVDDAVVVLESIHRHQRGGMIARQATLEGTNAVALPVLASTFTTMAVLLPVLLLAGLAKKLFAPLALTVAMAMTASYFVSMVVTRSPSSSAATAWRSSRSRPPRWPTSFRPSQESATSCLSVQLDYPEIHVNTQREVAGFVGIDARRAAQTTLDGSLGDINTPSVWINPDNGQSYYVVTYDDRHKTTETQQLADLPVRVDPEGRPVLLGTYGDIVRKVGPIAVERNHLERALHVLMQTERRDIGSVAKDIDDALARSAATHDLKYDWVGETQLMRTIFSGLGLALGLAVMVVFMIMASQFKSLRLPFVILFTILVALVGVALALMAEGQGVSITALMGILMVIGIAVSNGILLVDDASGRLREGKDKATAIVEAARSRFVPIMMTSLATVIGLVQREARGRARTFAL